MISTHNNQTNKQTDMRLQARVEAPTNNYRGCNRVYATISPYTHAVLSNRMRFCEDATIPSFSTQYPPTLLPLASVSAYLCFNGSHPSAQLGRALLPRIAILIT